MVSAGASGPDGVPFGGGSRLWETGRSALDRGGRPPLNGAHPTRGLHPPPETVGAVAQMGERCNRTAEVRGSIPLSSTNSHYEDRGIPRFLLFWG